MYNDVIRLVKSRSEAIFLWSWGTLISCLIAGQGFPSIYSTLIAVSSVAFLTASVYLYNDIIDREMDTLNPDKGKRPIATGKVSVGFAQRFVFVAAIIGSALMLLNGIQAFVWAFSYYALFFIYSYPGIRLKRLFIVKELVISMAFPLLSLAGAAAVTGGFYAPCLYAGILTGAFLFCALPALNEAFDVKEDLLYEIKSLAVVLNWKTRVQMLAFGVLMLIVVTPSTYSWFGFNTALPVVIVAASLVVLRFIVPIYGEFDRGSAYQARRIFKIYFFLVQIMMVVGNMALPILNLF
ncbi:hypothetical protein A3K69_01055 [Candidatus Bathyarchaeota archaeon RBG_16_57_9]|nr:MAG: hypothetical protein A3K69_01055 [Candidatus Bathyarchaeota archaeon RBG_16_57_9]